MITARNVTHTSKTTRENVTQKLLSVMCSIGNRWLRRAELERVDIDMNMVVNQAWHECFSAAIYSVGCSAADVPGGNLLDLVPLDKDGDRPGQFRRDSVEQKRILKQNTRHADSYEAWELPQSRRQAQ
jgi:hypothetical protein